MTAPELKPCPHCGKAPRIYLDEDPFSPGGPMPTKWVITCCATMIGSRDRDKTIALWNQRSFIDAD